MNAITFDILVQPRASRSRIGPRRDGRIVVAVTAPPIDGKANAAVIELVADALGVGTSHIEVIAGVASRRKTLRVSGVTRQQIDALLG